MKYYIMTFHFKAHSFLGIFYQVWGYSSWYIKNSFAFFTNKMIMLKSIMVKVC